MTIIIPATLICVVGIIFGCMFIYEFSHNERLRDRIKDLERELDKNRWIL